MCSTDPTDDGCGGRTSDMAMPADTARLTRTVRQEGDEPSEPRPRKRSRNPTMEACARDPYRPRQQDRSTTTDHLTQCLEWERPRTNDHDRACGGRRQQLERRSIEPADDDVRVGIDAMIEDGEPDGRITRINDGAGVPHAHRSAGRHTVERLQP